MSEIREFSTGATRDTNVGKFDYEGFYSPLVMERFAQYMHKHRKQSDGNLRDSDNWQKGIPKTAYMKSKMRHDMDMWFHHRGYSQNAREDLEEALCGILFNTQGYLFEILKDKLEKTKKPYTELSREKNEISVENWKLKPLKGGIMKD